MHTITKYKHNFLSVTLNTVTFVYAHLWKMMKVNGLHTERIYKNEAFWLECISKAQQFFKTCLLPEILGKYYTRPNSSLTQVTDSGQPSSNDSLESRCGDTDHSQTLGNSSNSSESIDMSDASGTNRLSRSNTTNDADGTSRASKSKSTNDSRVSRSNTTNNASGTSRVSSSNTTNDADGISRASRSNNVNNASGTSRSRVSRSSTLDLRPSTSNSMRSVLMMTRNQHTATVMDLTKAR